MIWFALHILGEPLDPWQQWAVIHLGELLEDGRPRFRQVLILVARQAGKTHLCKVLALYWLFVERQRMVFGTSTNLEQAKEAWEFAVDTAGATPALAVRIPPRGVRIGNGQQVLSTTDRCRYKIGAADRRGGRGKSIDRAIGDELREQHTWEAYNAATFAMNARPAAQTVYITNQGDARSVVLNSLRKDALAGTDPRLGILEWSAPPGTHPADPAGWAAANPNLLRRRRDGSLAMDVDALAGPAARVSKPGADPAELAGFLTEALCMAVDHLSPAVDVVAWARPAAEGGCLDPGDLSGARSRVALVLDVAPDARHASLLAAAVLPDDRVRVEPVAAWDGPGCTDQARRDLPGHLARVRPQVFGWFPAGPAAALAADLAERKGRTGWPPPGVKVEEIRGEERAAVCMGFAEQVIAGRVAQSADPLLDAQIAAAERLQHGDTWVFSRRGEGHVDAVYAAAGAVHLARTLPPPLPPLSVVTVNR